MKTVIDQILFLQGVPIFKDLTVEQLGHIASVSTTEEYEEGEFLFREGDVGDNSYVIISGKVELLKNIGGRETTRIDVLNEGKYFGEMSVFDGNERVASARTMENSLIISYTRDDLNNVIMEYPSIGLGIIRVLSERLRSSMSLLNKYESMFSEFKRFSSKVDKIMESKQK